MDESHKHASFHLQEILEQAKPESAVRIQDDYAGGEGTEGPAGQSWGTCKVLFLPQGADYMEFFTWDL